MSRGISIGTFALVLLGSGAARAHVGAVPAVATFTSPVGPVAPDQPPPTPAPPEPPYTPLQADQSAHVAWSDGDVDPTGHFAFYALPYQPHYQIRPDWLRDNATPVLEVGASAGPVSIWVACDCSADAGVACPDVGVRDCRNAFEWDTSQLADGAWWLIAINDDPPFLNASVANGPVLVHHGAGAPPPAVVVLQPDGRGSYDATYPVLVWASGTPPFTFDLAYGDSLTLTAGPGPTTPLGTGLALTDRGDGTWLYSWDLRGLPSLHAYFLDVKLHDASGRTVETMSRYQLAVYHPPDMAGELPPDFAGTHPSSGCDVSPAAPASPLPALLGGVLAALALAGLALARARSHSGRHRP